MTPTEAGELLAQDAPPLDSELEHAAAILCLAERRDTTDAA